MQLRNVPPPEDGEGELVACLVERAAGVLKAAGLVEVPLKVLERAAIINALEAHDGNRTVAAAALGIAVRTLQRKLKAMQIEDGGVTSSAQVRAAAQCSDGALQPQPAGNGHFAAASLFG
jgi:hypothetical protein